MRLMKLKKSIFRIILLTTCLSFGVNVLAAAGGDSGGGTGAAGDEAYQKAISKLNQLQSSIETSKANLKSLIKAKNEWGKKSIAPGTTKADLVRQIKENHDELKKQQKEYAEKRNEVRFKFPAQGNVIERRYMPIGVQTLEDVEQEMGLDGELTNVKRKIIHKYQHFLKSEDVEKEVVRERKRVEQKNSKKRLRLER